MNRRLRNKLSIKIFYFISLFLIVFFAGVIFFNTRRKDLNPLSQLADQDVAVNQYNPSEGLNEDELYSMEEVYVKDINKEFTRNNEWISNNNILQYSVYIIQQTEFYYRIEAMVFTILDSTKQSQYKCVLTSSVSKNIFILNALNMYKTPQPDVRKVICAFDNQIFPENDQIGVAILLENDFLNEPKIKKDQFPLKYINYQIPDYINIIEPRLPEVGVCLQYVSNVYDEIKGWIKLHQNFQVPEIIMYDGTDAQTLNTMFNNEFSFLKVYNNFLNYPNCSVPRFRFVKAEVEVLDAYEFRCLHASLMLFNNSEKLNHVSSNDCFIQLRYKYEFVTLYDLDELILPRNYDIFELRDISQPYRCLEKSQICSLMAFTSMYTYLRRLVKNSFTYEISKLRSIEFDHAAYFIPNEIQTKLIDKMKQFAKEIKLDTFQGEFPLKIPVLEGGETFLVEKEDVEYMLYLIKNYDAFMCYYDSHLKNIKERFIKNMVRFLYYITKPWKRIFKSIYYSKNVHLIFTHEAMVYNKGSHVLKAPWITGHLNAHFRLDLSVFFNQYSETSIKKLVIDVEHMAYILQNFTNFC